MNAESRHRHRNGQLEVVRRGGEREGHRLAVRGANLLGHEEGNEEHQHEVDQQRDGDAHHVERKLHDGFALEREHHHDGEEQGDERDGADLGDELRVVPLLVLEFDQTSAGGNTGNEGDAEVDEDTPGDLSDGDVDCHTFEAEPGRQHSDENIGIDRVEEHLEDRVEGDQPGAVFGIALGQVVPDDDHGDATRQPDHDQAHHVLGLVVQE